MGKGKPDQSGGAEKEAKGQQSAQQRRSPRTAGHKAESVATPVSEGVGPGKKRLLAAVSASRNKPSSAKRPPSTGRKLLALSAHKRLQEGKSSDGTASGSKDGTPMQISPSPEPESAANKSQSPSLRPGAPPMTVAEAQELGEQARLRDETLWALEGLNSSNGPAQYQSLVTLAEIYANRRNRLVMHSTVLGTDLISSIAKLRVSDDLVLALGAATVLLLSTQVGGDQMVFARDDVNRLTASLLEVSSSLPMNAVPAPAARFLRILHDPIISKVLPKEATFCPAAVTLAALCTSLDPHNCTAEIDKIKHSLRTAGTLQAAAQLAADQTQALVDPSPTMLTVQRLWQLDRSLIVLEHSCFACLENEAHLIDMEITQGVAPMLVRLGLAQWLIQQLQALSRLAVIAGLKKECLRGVLAVLMNITHNNASGCAKVVAVSGLEAACHLLSKLCLGTAHIKGVLTSADELKSWHDELNGCLGLLINCADGNKGNCSRMRSMELPLSDGDVGAGGSGGSTGLVALLSRLISTILASWSNLGDGIPQGSQAEEVTLDALQHGEGEAAASTVEVYAAILLGFLIEGDREAQKEAAALLPGNSIAPVISAVQRCLNFYVTAGALTQQTEASLRTLLASLQADAS